MLRKKRHHNWLIHLTKLTRHNFNLVMRHLLPYSLLFIRSVYIVAMQIAVLCFDWWSWLGRPILCSTCLVYGYEERESLLSLLIHTRIWDEVYMRFLDVVAMRIVVLWSIIIVRTIKLMSPWLRYILMVCGSKSSFLVISPTMRTMEHDDPHVCLLL